MTTRQSAHAFRFQAGSWKVLHRKLRSRLTSDSHWDEFAGTCRAWEILGGGGNVDDHWLEDPSGAYAAATVRRLEPDDSWSIWWIDSRRRGVEGAMRGRFAAGEGIFYGRDIVDGRSVEVRFIWSAMTSASPKWEQAFSADGGLSWETNWIMEFTKAS